MATRKKRHYVAGEEQDRNPETEPASILLVDDDLDLLYALAELLELESFSVRTAVSVPCAVALLTQQPFDVMVTDYDLKGAENGGHLLDFAAVRFPQMKRILHSAAAVPSGLDADAVLSKTDLDNLVDVIRNVPAGSKESLD